MKKLDMYMENRKQSFGRPLPAESCRLAGLFCLRTHLRRSACAPPGKSCILLGELPRTHTHTLYLWGASSPVDLTDMDFTEMRLVVTSARSKRPASAWSWR